MRLDGCIPFFLQNCWLIFGCCTVPGCHPTSTGQKNVSRQPAQSFGGLGMDAAVLPNWIFRRSRNHKERWKGSFFVELLEGTFQGVVKVGDPMSSIYFGDLQGPFQ